MLAADSLSRVLGALADPTRRSILARLAKGDATVAEVAAPFPMSQPAISKHLKVLEAAGLVTRSRRATARLSHLEAKPLQAAAAWIEDYQRFWADSFDALEDHLTTVKDTTVTNKEQE
ncbi:MAG: helix-turn-helix transcriptional regulator [Acidobacteriota bacterium]|nr:helix-turn-helix transcriptional regulator [Acidobacteriota bacterium]